MSFIVHNDFFHFPIVPTIFSKSDMFDDTQLDCGLKLSQVFKMLIKSLGSLSNRNWSLSDFILKTSLSVVSCFQISFKIVVEPARRIKLKPFSNNSILSLQLDFNFIVRSRFWILWSNYFNFVTICCAVILKNCYRPWQLIKMVAQLQRLDEINNGHILLCNNQKWINFNAFLWIIFYFL